MEQSRRPKGDRVLDDWMATSRTDEAARNRRRTAAWREHGPVDASLAGVLLDLADRGTEVLLSLTGGRSHRVVIIEVAATWVLARTRADDCVLLRLRCVASLDCCALPLSFGERSAPVTAGFVATLHRLAEVGDVITMWSGAQTTSGELRVLGDEIAVVALDAATTRYVSLDEVDEVIITVSPSRSWRQDPSGYR